MLPRTRYQAYDLMVFGVTQGHKGNLKPSAGPVAGLWTILGSLLEPRWKGKREEDTPGQGTVCGATQR